MNQNLTIEIMSLEDVIPYEKNAKLHPQEQIEQIKQSILQFGNNDPIAIDRNNVVVEGHGRLLALKQLGYTEAPVIKLGHLTEDQRKAYALVHNKLTMNSGFDLDLLREGLCSVDDIDFGLLGFDDVVVDLNADTVKEDEPDVRDLKSREPLSRPGQIYQLGEHRLMCGDSTTGIDAALLMDGQLARLVVTDPPYNVNYKGAHGASIQNDNMSDSDFVAFLSEAFSVMRASLVDGGAFYIWHADGKRYEFDKALIANDLIVRQCLIWVKHAMVLGRQDYQWKHEACLYGWKDGASHYFTLDRTHTTVVECEDEISAMSDSELRQYIHDLHNVLENMSSVMRVDRPMRSAEHPTMKPVKLLAKSIVNSSAPGDVVLDLFGGSGSTMLACEQLGRKCYMMELDPVYVDVIIQRWQEFTGKKAVLLKE